MTVLALTQGQRMVSERPVPSTAHLSVSAPSPRAWASLGARNRLLQRDVRRACEDLLLLDTRVDRSVEGLGGDAKGEFQLRSHQA